MKKTEAPWVYQGTSIRRASSDKACLPQSKAREAVLWLGCVQNIFPQISRFFSSRVMQITPPVLLYAFLFLIIAANSSLLGVGGTSRAILARPFDPSLHISLANTCFNYGNSECAIREIAYADYLEKSQNVLGATMNIYNEWERGLSRLNSSLLYWKDISERYPLYKDAHLQYGILLYELGDFEKAQKELEKTLSIDPYNENATLLLRTLSHSRDLY